MANFLNVALLAFVAQRVAGVVMAYLAHASPLLVGALVLPCVAGLVAAIAVWVGRKMEGSLIALGATVVVTAIIEVALIGGDRGAKCACAGDVRRALDGGIGLPAASYARR